jgi:two-component sensor histidine kinase
VKLAEAQRPDMALMDIRLEGEMDGIAAARALGDQFSIPVIYLTAHADAELLEQARQTEPYGYLVKPLQDLSLKTTLDMALARLEVTRKLEKATAEKEILMRETLHRTKNNMATIISLLNIESENVADKQAKDVFQDMQNRIESMMIAQEKLYRSDDLADIDLGEYLKDLADAMFANYDALSGNIALAFDMAPDIIVHIDVAMPCGLIVTELISNAVKYAFPDDRTGSIRVSLRRTEDELIELGVCDTGVGMPENFDLNKIKTFGLEIVKGVAEFQIRGNVELKTDNGVAFFLRFAPPGRCQKP